ncbi:MAG: cytochrome c-type biogenesis protein [Solirubrobacteraceae bacterium]
MTRRAATAHARRRWLATVAASTLLALTAAAALTAPAPGWPGTATATAATTRGPSFEQLQGEFMCVVCHEPLAVADSPEAYQERQYIRTLIGQGRSAAQIKTAMVGAYGTAVLASPPSNGFNVLLYVVPPLVLALGIAIVLVVLPRWRARTRAAAAEAGRAQTPAPQIDSADARRLDEELGRFA